MQIRTDLALEQRELSPDLPKGVRSEAFDEGNAHISRITVEDADGAAALGKPEGRYITVEIPPLSDDNDMDGSIVQSLKRELGALLPAEGTVLVAGLGNTAITPDALGPKAADAVLATRHITGELARSAGLENLRGGAGLSPGVLGSTGIETSEILEGVVQKIRPSAVLAIDALASRRLARLGCTIQISDSGISPGSGVGNRRKEISAATLGLPVIAVGIPTVVDARTLAADLVGEGCAEQVNPRGEQMIVTPREIDLIIQRASSLLGHAINCALQPAFDPAFLLAIAK